MYINRKVTASTITDKVIRYYVKKGFCVNREIGLCKYGRLRADFLAISMKHEVIIIEVKSCPADFSTDHKWKKYLPYCNKLYFAVNSNTYERIKDKIPNGIGVLLCDSMCPTVVQKAKTREMDDQRYLEIVTRVAFRQSEFNRYNK